MGVNQDEMLQGARQAASELSAAIHSGEVQDERVKQLVHWFGRLDSRLSSGFSLPVDWGTRDSDFSRADEVGQRVRGGGSGAGGVKYDDVVEVLRKFDGAPVSYVKLAELLGVWPYEAESLAADLILSRHSVVIVSGPRGEIELDYEPGDKEKTDA